MGVLASFLQSFKRHIGPRTIPSVIYHTYHLGSLASRIFNRFPLHSKTNPLQQAPFFIIGAGRSGNTLLRSIIAGNPTVCIPPESYVLGRVIRHYQFYNFFPWDFVARIVISEFESHNQFFTWEINLCDFYQQALNLGPEERDLANLLNHFYLYYARLKCPQAIRWGDKTPINTFSLPLINQAFPKAKYIHMIRDGRDVVSSYLMAQIRSVSSCEKTASIRWLRSVETAQKFGATVGSAQYLEIFYERLVQKPEDTIQNVCRFLEIDYDPGMLQFWQAVDNLGDTKLAHHQNLRHPINEKSIGKWRKNLDPHKKAIVTRLLKDKLLALNYGID